MEIKIPPIILKKLENYKSGLVLVGFVIVSLTSFFNFIDVSWQFTLGEKTFNIFFIIMEFGAALLLLGSQIPEKKEIDLQIDVKRKRFIKESNRGDPCFFSVLFQAKNVGIDTTITDIFLNVKTKKGEKIQLDYNTSAKTYPIKKGHTIPLDCSASGKHGVEYETTAIIEIKETYGKSFEEEISF